MPEQLMKLVYTKTKLAASGKDIMQKKKSECTQRCHQKTIVWEKYEF
jgi:hypothetical protein